MKKLKIKAEYQCWETCLIEWVLWWINGSFRSVDDGRLCLWWRNFALSCQPVDKEGSKVSYPPAHGGTILNLPKVGGLKSQLSTCTWEFSRPGHKTRFPEFLGAIKKSIFRAHKKEMTTRSAERTHHIQPPPFGGHWFHRDQPARTQGSR